MERIGTVVEGATPSSFVFQADSAPVPLHDYVVVVVEEHGVGPVQVLGEVVGVGAHNPLARPGMAGGEDYLSGVGYHLMSVEVLGYRREGRLYRPKTPPRPESPVYRAEDALLNEFFRGVEERIPLRVGCLVNRPQVPVYIHLQDFQFHLAILAQTRAGKSYLAGKIIEEILRNTYFPVIVLDIHGDYVMMDQAAEGGKHGEFDVVVYYPPGAPKVPGVTAEERILNVSPRQMPYEALGYLLGHLGPLQTRELRSILKNLAKEGSVFGLEDIVERVSEEMDRENSAQRKNRLASILMRLEDLGEDVPLSPEELQVEDLLRPKTLSVVCLRGLRSRIQDTYAGLIVDLVFRHLVVNSGDPVKAPPTFLFIEEAHRVASKEGGGRYAVRSVSTAIREGAKFGLFITLISQRPRSIDPDVLANVGNYAVLRIVNAQDQSMIANASESFSQRLVEDLPALNQGEAVLVGPFTPLPVQVKVEERMTMHRGVTPRLKELNEAIGEAVKRAMSERW